MKHTRVWPAAILAVVGVGSGCAVTVDGDFDGLGFAPSRSASAVLDTHAILDRGGALIPVELPRAQFLVDLWLTSADVPTDEAWRQLPAERLVEIRKDLADSDVVHLSGISFDALQDRDPLEAQTNAADAAVGAGVGDGDFRFAVGQRADADTGSGLGGKITVEIEAQQLVRDDVRGGHLDATVTITRERAAEQPAGNLATGTVTLVVSLPLAPERVAEANLAIVGPIARCKAERGPDVGAGCATIDANVVVDATGSH